MAGAARDILRGLAKKAGIETYWERSKVVVVEEYQESFRDLMHKDYNFFKHSAKDHDVSHDRYQPSLTAFVLFEACYDFGVLFKENYFEIALFRGWFLIMYPRMVKPEFKDEFGDIQRLLNIRPSMPWTDSLLSARGMLSTLDERPELIPADAAMLRSMGAHQEWVDVVARQ